MKKLPYCVYMLRSQQDGLLYIGFTTDLHRRLTEQIHGQSEATAPRREGYFKTSPGKKALKLMLRESLTS